MYNFYNPLKHITRSKITLGYFQDSLREMQKENEKSSNELKKLNLNDIILEDFPIDKYYRVQTNKKQIVIHHTVSGRGVGGDINWWKQNPSRIATSIIIDWKGNIHQCFSTNYWAHHLGIGSEMFYRYGITNIDNVKLNKLSIGVEIDAWGGLVEENGKWYPAYWDDNKRKYTPNKRVSELTKDRVYEIPEGYRGFKAYEKYTDEQIESLRQLIVFWGEKFDIPLKYNESMWDINENALRGESGIWSHTSYRYDKSDCYPDERLIKMLKSL